MILIAGILESYRSLKDRTLKITFETSEPTPEQLTSIALSTQKFGFVAFRVGEKEGELMKVMESLPKQDIEGGKTKSQRLRGVLYIKWEQNKKGYEVFDDYYNFYMERIITHYKDTLD